MRLLAQFAFCLRHRQHRFGDGSELETNMSYITLQVCSDALVFVLMCVCVCVCESMSSCVCERACSYMCGFVRRSAALLLSNGLALVARCLHTFDDASWAPCKTLASHACVSRGALHSDFLT